MATQTTNYGLIKPKKIDPILIDQINENMDMIDEILADQKTETTVNSDSLAQLSEKSTLNRSTLGYQRKNLLKNTAVSQTINGVAYTVNEDGSVTANGTATANAQIVIFDGKPDPEMLNQKLHLSGCPDGGSTLTYRMIIQNATSGFSTLCVDSGSGADVIIASNTTRIRCLFTVYSEQTVENITLYPMLRYTGISDDTYEPYKPSVEERLAALEAAVLGGGEA